MDHPLLPVPDFFASLGATLHPVQVPGIGAWEIVLALLWAAGACFIPRVWRIFSPFVALVHEVGHATAALSAGHHDISVKVHSYGDGGFDSKVLGTRGLKWAVFWGYPMPALVGAGLFSAALAGWAPLALAVDTAALLWSLMVTRNRFGFLLALGCFVTAVTLVWLASPAAAGHVALFLGLALLVAAIRDFFMVKSFGPENVEGDTPSDANILAENSGAPARFWLTLFAGTIAAAWYGAIAAAAPLFLAAS
ncbi:M50 family metallopeptidase [Arthrobacter sp. 2MCAF14]|uniref:M50 family metallopeptidase n=1 Tax=Arthrobacter sp. 2MCAF14 TaxID=3232982 RepID=UPI003F8E6E93